MGFRTVTACTAAVMFVAGCSTTSEPPAASSSPTTTSSTAGSGPIRGPLPPVATPLVGSVLAAPVPVPASDGKTHLAYEVQLTNVLAQEITLTSFVVLDRDVSLLNHSGDQLAGWTRIIGTTTPTTKIGPAQTAVVWVDLALDEGATVPSRLVHAIGLSLPDPKPPLFPATMTIDIAPVDVGTREPVVISPPLTGSNWLDGGGCCDMVPHRMALNPIDGQLWAAERFAIDYVQLESDAREYHGDPTELESYPAFGNDVRAVADGPVVAAVDGLPEQIPGKVPTGLALDQYPGNHIVQDLGGGNFALYAHLKTGTVAVKPGDRLSAGQVIGAVGNTGNSSSPHLHFHVMSTADPLRSDGLPFVYTDFRVDSRIAVSLEELEELPDDQPVPLQPGLAARDEKDVMPMNLDVMTYAD
ncbi:M23 family metallopeptidase [Mycobacterium barrassiae]|uniref:M23 family metallopeptidase n=1 Tax=Mycobacterium barrassiae TaxID=319709 RepID=UPI002265E1A0|nr:M23 family metallopeptidase [Mycobacterium barrassiae]MCV7301968.1 M23 family metallopeptidase [Mycobacterium barrassiae]